MIRTHDAPVRTGDGAAPATELVDVLVAPSLLFARASDPARWKRFLLANTLCVMLGSALIASVRMHVAPIGAAKGNAAFVLIATPLSFALLMALGIGLSLALALLLQRPLKSRVPFADTWTLVNEIALVKLGLSTLVLGAIVVIRGARAFVSPQDIARAMPSLAMLVPQAPDRVAAVLGVIDPFNVWVCCLFALAFRLVFRARGGYAAWAGFAIGLVPQILVRLIVH